MKLAILHLSDIHISRNDDIVFSRIDSISQALNNLDIEKIPILIVLSGDISDSGQKNEYDLAKDFLDKIKSKLLEKGFIELYIISVPGNHDCNFSDKDYCEMRLLAKKEIVKSPDEIKSVYIKNCLDVQNNYFDFSNLYSICSCQTDEKSKLFYRKNLDINGKNIAINILNTSWLSEINEKQGNIVYPYKYIDDLTEHTDLSISILHHPFNWVDSDNASKVSLKVESISDIIFTGHEHESKSTYKNDFTNNFKNYYFKGGILQDRNNSKNSCFNLFIIDFDNETIRFLEFVFEINNYAIKLDKESKFLREQTILRNKFHLTDIFFDKLNDIGISLTHKGKEKIYLSDLFVMPNFKIIKDDETLEYTEGKNILNKNNLLLIGNQNSGKSTFAKYLYRYYYNNSQIPVLIYGGELKHNNDEKVKSLLKDKLSEQYNVNSIDSFVSIEKNKRVLIIDDFHLSKLNFKSKNSLLSKFQLYFDNIIVLSDNFVQLEVLLNKSEKDALLSDFDHYRFLHFGHYQRKILIEKWLSLGNEEIIEDSILSDNVLRLIELVDKLMGKNMFPKYPCFILLIMQQIEWQIPIDTQSVPYIHYYQSIITRAFEDSKYKIVELDTKYTFLSYIAHAIFCSEIKKITYSEIKTVYDNYYEKVKRHFNFDDIIEDFINVNILEKTPNHYSFKYQYLYNYFVSLYIIDGINKQDPDIKEIIDRLISSIHKEEFANIILFITYLSKDKSIIELLIKKANSIFDDIEPCDFDKHTNFLNSLISQIPKLIMQDRSPKENVDDLMKVKDEIDNYEDDTIFEEESETNEELSEEEKRVIEIASKINESIKTVQILGQVIKNSPGSIDADVKIKVTISCFSLGMKALNRFIKIVEENINSFVLFIEDIIRKEKGNEIDLENEIEREKIENLSKKIAFYILEFISIVFVKNISRAIGSNKLEEIFSEVLSENQLTSYKLINASIEIDYIEGFPDINITNLAEELSKNFFAFELLKMLVAEHFEFHEVNFKIKQRICSKLNISYEKIVQTEHLLKEIK